MRPISATFAPDGPLARALPGFESRPQQTRMAEEVTASLASGGTLLIEAGTGVGKSLAYLVPSILFATRPGTFAEDERRVIVSTHTRALQEQLARKDLPFLERALAPAGIVFRHALLMGSENYLCVQRLQQARAQAGLLSEDGEALGALLRHAESAPSGLRSEVPFGVLERLWSRVHRDRDICLGSHGPFWDACLYRRDLVRSREAHLLVVNHALFFLDLATGGRILPPHAAVILDEGHRAEEAAAGQFGVSVSDRAVARLLADLPAARQDTGSMRRVREAAQEVRESARRLFEELRRAAEDAPAGRAADPDTGARAALRAASTVRLRRPGLAENSLKTPLQNLEAALADASQGAGDSPEAMAFAALVERSRDLRGRLDLVLSQSMSDAVYWMESTTSRRAGATLYVTPIEVGPILRERLFDGRRRVILTSATLTAAGSFAHLRLRLGVGAASEVSLGSPYDFERQVLLYMPAMMPDPVASPGEYAEAVARECGRILEASGGGAFVLFTSYALLNRVHDALAADPALRDLQFFRHEPGEASAILEMFRKTRRGVLLGTLTFWQGIDVPGDALRCVILTRLPFEVPDHPVAEARAEAIRARGGDPFVEDSLPEAILTFRQGFGRLVRTREDRGLVAALDPRLRTRAYGRAFLDSLPPCRRTESIEEAERFLRTASF